VASPIYHITHAITSNNHPHTHVQLLSKEQCSNETDFLATCAQHWHRHTNIAKLLGGEHSSKRFRFVFRTDGVAAHAVYEIQQELRVAEKTHERIKLAGLRVVSGDPFDGSIALSLFVHCLMCM
jgi:hypothetical protein